MIQKIKRLLKAIRNKRKIGKTKSMSSLKILSEISDRAKALSKRNENDTIICSFRYDNDAETIICECYESTKMVF